MRASFGAGTFRGAPGSNVQLLSTVTAALYNDPNPANAGITELIYTPAAGGFDVENGFPALLRFAAPALLSINQYNYADIRFQPELLSIQMPKLEEAYRIRIVQNPKLTELTLTGLKTDIGTGTSWEIQANVMLTDIDVTSWQTPAGNIGFQGNAWSEATVNAILVKLDNIGWAAAGKNLELSGGTAAAPTGAGAAAKAALIAAGATVTTN